jgi:hypothetical protein
MSSGGSGRTPRRNASVEELLDAAGIVVTEEGRQRARARLDAARARWTPERWSAFWDQLGADPEDRVA